MIQLSAEEVRRRLFQGLIPAVPVPFTAAGAIDARSQERYVAWMEDQPAAGVAVWAHTGRGLHLTREQRMLVLRSWVKGLSRAKTVVAGVGGAPSLVATPPKFIESALEMGRDALEGGAHAFLVHPPAAFSGPKQGEKSSPKNLNGTLTANEESILDYHRQLASLGAPLILFYLYEAAGGISYSPALLRRLLSISQVVGIKLATLDSVMTFQSVANLVQTNFPEKLIITGEDRFLGYSLMCGAQAALIGMGAALTRMQYELLRSHFAGEAVQFQRLSAKADRLSQALFIPPMEGYILRMLWALVHEGVLDRESACDPWGPKLPESEFVAIGLTLRALDDAQAAKPKARRSKG